MPQSRNKIAWDNYRSGLEPLLPVGRAVCALALWRAEDAGIFKSEGSGEHRAAERDTTGSNGRQHSLHTWIDAPAQGASSERRTPATLLVIHLHRVRGSLTPWFYCA